MALAEFEDLFEVLRKRQNPFAEGEARWLFRQLLSGAEYLHRRGLGFRDHSLENVLMFYDDTENLVLPKITDPGQAVRLQFDTHGRLKELTIDKLFGKSFRPPEVYNKGTYNPIKVDVFCLGWMLFFTVTKQQPFDRAVASDPFWRLLVKRRYSELLCQRGGEYLSSELCDLLWRMLNLDPKTRPTPKECMCHAWFRGPLVPMDRYRLLEKPPPPTPVSTRAHHPRVIPTTQRPPLPFAIPSARRQPQQPDPSPLSPMSTPTATVRRPPHYAGGSLLFSGSGTTDHGAASTSSSRAVPSTSVAPPPPQPPAVDTVQSNNDVVDDVAKTKKPSEPRCQPTSSCTSQDSSTARTADTSTAAPQGTTVDGESVDGDTTSKVPLPAPPAADTLSSSNPLSVSPKTSEVFYDVPPAGVSAPVKIFPRRSMIKKHAKVRPASPKTSTATTSKSDLIEEESKPTPQTHHGVGPSSSATRARDQNKSSADDGTDPVTTRPMGAPADPSARGMDAGDNDQCAKEECNGIGHTVAVVGRSGVGSGGDLRPSASCASGSTREPSKTESRSRLDFDVASSSPSSRPPLPSPQMSPKPERHSPASGVAPFPRIPLCGSPNWDIRGRGSAIEQCLLPRTHSLTARPSSSNTRVPFLGRRARRGLMDCVPSIEERMLLSPRTTTTRKPCPKDAIQSVPGGSTPLESCCSTPVSLAETRRRHPRTKNSQTEITMPEGLIASRSHSPTNRRKRAPSCHASSTTTVPPLALPQQNNDSSLLPSPPPTMMLNDPCMANDSPATPSCSDGGYQPMTAVVPPPPPAPQRMSIIHRLETKNAKLDSCRHPNGTTPSSLQLLQAVLRRCQEPLDTTEQYRLVREHTAAQQPAGLETRTHLPRHSAVLMGRPSFGGSVPLISPATTRHRHSITFCESGSPMALEETSSGSSSILRVIASPRANAPIIPSQDISPRFAGSHHKTPPRPIAEYLARTYGGPQSYKQPLAHFMLPPQGTPTSAKTNAASSSTALSNMRSVMLLTATTSRLPVLKATELV